ncbi:hypothetical protein D918_08856 [Trichuris suis]|nr:hypothetical protein D918_08856 [Trichuris suis]
MPLLAFSKEADLDKRNRSAESDSELFTQRRPVEGIQSGTEQSHTVATDNSEWMTKSDSNVHVQSGAAQTALPASAYAKRLIESEVPPDNRPFLTSSASPSNFSASVAQTCAFLESHTVGKADEPPPEPPIDYETVPLTKDTGQPDSSTAVSVKSPVNKRIVNGSCISEAVCENESSLSMAVLPEEGPVNVLRNTSAILDKEILTEKPAKETANGNSLLARRNPHRRTVTKKTRVFVVDGVQVTSTTYHVMSDDDTHLYKAKEDFRLRKAELQEMRRLQKEEVRQFQELSLRAEMQRDQQSRKFEQDLQTLLREYENEVDSIMRCQKKQLEEAEKIQEDDMKIATKRLKVEEERQFVERVKHAHTLTLNRLDDSHRQKITLLERQFLQQKHQMLRAREAALWELEERQLHERHQLLKNQMKEDFFLQRSHMLVRHQKVCQQVLA